ncbi:hypothetical protein BDR04DRAFT_1090849 [Suillus decipiens]|nr:hypothetical protein BDR04DRAFT_1090849 [Suillus decipiens]
MSTTAAAIFCAILMMVCQRAPSAIEEASSVYHETDRGRSTGMHCTNARLGAN